MRESEQRSESGDAPTHATQTGTPAEGDGQMFRAVARALIDGAAEIGELRRNTGAGEPPAVAPE